MSFHPYINFGGNCAEAFTRYQEILGGELQILRMADLPAEDRQNVPAEAADMVMHAALVLDDDVLLASDDFDADFEGARGMYVNYTLDDPVEAERVFAALAEGGSIEMDLAETFWSPRFGICIDRFGTPWMINANPPEGSPQS